MENNNLPSLRDTQGAVLPPLVLYMLGVPVGLVLLLWFFFFR